MSGASSSQEPAPDGASEVWSRVLPRSARTDVDDRGTTDAERYQLADRPEPPPVPNGWYAAAMSADLAPGEVTSLIAVERELVVFRGSDGAAHILDAHCPHLGAHLGGGEVRGDTLQCPFHGWRYDGDGTCVEIPYGSGRIPSRACVRSYPVREQDGLILFWFHAAGAEPSYEVPTFDEAHDPAWSGPRLHRGELVAALQDMAENNVDPVHFAFVHGRASAQTSTSEFLPDGPFSTVIESFDGTDLTFTRWTYGPGLALLRIPRTATVLTTTTPIDRRHVRLLWQFWFPPGMEPLADDIVAGVIGEHGLGADAPIWRDKVFLERPLVVRGDGPIMAFRRWYEQFYEGSRPTPAILLDQPGEPI